jgi:glutamate/tyrosine decarboxylase-like PLP-dependent enzyme
MQKSDDGTIDTFSRLAKAYLSEVGNRRVFPSAAAIENLEQFDVPLQNDSRDPTKVLEELDAIGSPATVASAGGRYFGFVTGGVLPAPLGANLLAGVWDQNAGLDATSPVAAHLEEVCATWLTSIFGLPRSTGVGFVTGATMANFAALASARSAVLKGVGWDVEENGLFEAPPIQIVVGAEVHVSVLKALGLLGFGKKRVIRAAVDSQGRMRPETIPTLVGPSIICAQAGNVNTGAFDPLEAIYEKAREMNSWVHVDGAFGLWAAACPERAHLTKGLAGADSWATDAHKWLNVPYDSGLVFVRERQHLASAMATTAAYLASSAKREPFHYVPELSRRARAVEIWAALRSLGKNGLADMVNRNCELARLFAQKLKAAGHSVLNEVVLNQVLVSFGTPETTRRVIQAIQKDGTCWCGGTEWQGNTAMRISVSSWKTTDKDVEQSVQAILRIAASEFAGS